MSRDFLSAFFIVSTILLTFTTTVYAHRVNVFAFEQNGMIVAEAKFNSGRPAKGATVTIHNQDGDNNVVLSGITDQQGIFTFPVPDEAVNNQYNLNIVVDAGGGHQGSWLLNADDYLANTNPGDRAADSHPPAKAETEYSASQPNSRDHMSSNNVLQQLIQQAVAQEVAPIKKLLLEQQQQKITIQDIIGGLGYIFGLAGIAAYFQAKKR